MLIWTVRREWPVFAMALALAITSSCRGGIETDLVTTTGAIAKSVVEVTATPVQSPTPIPTPAQETGVAKDFSNVASTTEVLPVPTIDIESKVNALVIAALTAIPTSTPVPTPTPAPLTKTLATFTTTRMGIQPTPVVGQLPLISDVVDQVTPWVVAITTEILTRSRFFQYSNQGAGSGFIVTADGYVVTNSHVVHDATEVNVHLNNGETHRADVVGEDSVTDLAVIKIDADGLSVAKIGMSAELNVGDWVLAIGNALAIEGGPTVTLGIVSALGRNIQTDKGEFYDLIQTDAAVNQGNSGGPLVNLNGEVVGINQAILKQAQGVSFAVSSSTADPIISDLIAYGRVIRPLIGFNGIGVTANIAAQLDLSVTEGVIVRAISTGTPGYEAGMRFGDVMISIDDIPTPDVPTWLNLLWTYEVGDEVEVKYIRDGEEFTTIIKLGERP